jgi:hypothetical protein
MAGNYSEIAHAKLPSKGSINPLSHRWNHHPPNVRATGQPSICGSNSFDLNASVAVRPTTGPLF